MAINQEVYTSLMQELQPQNVTLIAVSKTKPVSDLLALYNLGQRDFGENYVQELVEKEKELPKDIRWHFIGHLQTNKVKYIAPFVHLIHGIDSVKVLKEVSKQGIKLKRKIDVLLQVHIASEETKYGFNPEEVGQALIEGFSLDSVEVQGFMGMASLSSNIGQIISEFKSLKTTFDREQNNYPSLSTLSMGMTTDYKYAIEAGSNMVRIGSALFGQRQ